MSDCTGKTITELWAWVVLDPTDGNEGIPAFMDINGTWMPMIMGDGERIQQLEAQAKLVAMMSPHPVQLRKFSVMTVERELAPGVSAAKPLEAGTDARG